MLQAPTMTDLPMTWFRVILFIPSLLLLLLLLVAVRHAVAGVARALARPTPTGDASARLHARRGLALAGLGIAIALSARLLRLHNPFLVQYIPLAMMALGAVSALRAFLQAGGAADAQAPAAPDSNTPVVETGGEIVSMVKGVGDLRFSAAGRTIRGGSLRLGIGDLDMDLAGVSLPAGTHVLKAHVGMGDLRIRLPADVPTRIEAAVGLGEVRLGTQSDSGIANRLVRETPGYSDAVSRLVIAAFVGVGEIRIP